MNCGECDIDFACAKEGVPCIRLASPAAPQPEQFGWFYDITTGDEKRFGPIWQGGEKREHVEIVAADVGGKVFPLYAAPPAAPAVPLTDESVNARVAAMAADRDYWRERVLALESAAPVVRLTDAQKQRIHDETGAGHALICLVESYIHGIGGGNG